MAAWADFEPGTEREHETHEVELSTKADVRELVDRLTRPDTSEAVLTHASRPFRLNEFTGEPGSDHHVVVGVFKGFGYLEYTDPDHVSQIAGDPSSPEWHTTMSDYFHPGTGVALDTLVDLIEEFRTTAARPTAVRWRDALSG